MQCAWQVEIDPYCVKVLTKHWPDVPKYGDIRSIDWATVLPVDVLCGGFPCQPHSIAGKRMASNDDRDLWPEFVRAICGLRPKWVVAENVRGLLSSESGRFFGGVLRDLADSGYDAEWQIIPAAAFGAPHIRERIWILAYPQGVSGNELQVFSIRSEQGMGEKRQFRGHYIEKIPQRSPWELHESPICRGDDGVSNIVDRLHQLGNALVPQIAEWIGRRIRARCDR
jgi:DNA (cytosine-5)-methyltransferase 1